MYVSQRLWYGIISNRQLGAGSEPFLGLCLEDRLAVVERERLREKERERIT